MGYTGYTKSKRSLLKRESARLLRCTSYSVSNLLGIIHGNRVTAYWFVGQKNFGDLITPLLLKHYGLTPIRKPPHAAELVSTGSILQSVSRTYPGTILGSGLMHEQPVTGYPLARVLGVRGALTRQLIGAADDVILGDPGLLARGLFTRATAKKYVLGLAPHIVDKQDERLQQIAQRYPHEVTVIDVQRAPEKVFYDIDCCEAILSSSLHGLVTADSLGVPNAWITLSDRVKGNGFKFRDYYSALDASFETCTLSGRETLAELTGMTHAPPAAVDRVCGELDRIFRAFAAEVLS